MRHATRARVAWRLPCVTVSISCSARPIAASAYPSGRDAGAIGGGGLWRSCTIRTSHPGAAARSHLPGRHVVHRHPVLGVGRVIDPPSPRRSTPDRPRPSISVAQRITPPGAENGLKYTCRPPDGVRAVHVCGSSHPRSRSSASAFFAPFRSRSRTTTPRATPVAPQMTASGHWRHHRWMTAWSVVALATHPRIRGRRSNPDGNTATPMLA